MSVNAPPTDPNAQGVNANVQMTGNVVTGFGPPVARPPIPQMPQAAQDFVGTVAPRAQTASGPLTPSITHQKLGETTKPLFSPNAYTPGPSAMNQLVGKTERFFQQGADIASVPGYILFQIGKDTVQEVYRTGEYQAKLTGNLAERTVEYFTSKDLAQRKDTLMNNYKSGKINNIQYNQATKELASDYKNLASIHDATASQTGTITKTLAYNSAQTALLLLSMDASAIPKTLQKFASGAGADTAMAQAITKLLGEGAGNYFVKGGELVSKGISKVPAFGKIINDSVDASILASNPSLLAQSKSAAAAIFIKKPLLYNANITQAKDVYDRMAKGDYGHALIGIGLLGAQALGGGPFGYARKLLGKGTAKLGELTFGVGSFIDELSGRVFNGDRAGIYKYLEALRIADETSMSGGATYENTIRRLKELEHVNMRVTGGRVAEAVDRVTNSLVDSGFDLQVMTHGEVVKNGIGWAEAASKLDETIKAGLMKGVDAADAGKYAVGRLDTASKFKLAELFAKVDENLTTASSAPTMADKVAARRAAWSEFANANPNVAFTNNINLANKVDKMISSIEDSKKLTESIKGIVTARELEGLPADVQKFLADRGMVVIRPQVNVSSFTPFEETSGVLHTDFALPKDLGYFAQTVQPVPILSHIGTAVEKMGLSPRDATQLVQDLHQANLADSLNQLRLSKDFTRIKKGETAADNITKRLDIYARDRKIPITDLRQLTIKDLTKALGVSEHEAKLVAGALNDSMIRVPLEFRGLGDRIVDYNIKYNPLAPGYARIQSTFRYAWNPFFKWKLDTKTEVFAQLEANGKSISYPGINKFNELVFPAKAGHLEDVAMQLEKSGILTTGFGGEGAQDLVVGQIGARLTKSQRISLAGVADSMAKTQGISVEQLLIDHPQQVTDALRILVQYPKTGFVNSPLVRTLNVAFFPTRFNVKVAELTAKALAKQQPYMQVAIIKGMYNFNAWLKTDEGIAWQSNHADVLSILEYVSPLHTLTQVMANLQGHSESVGDFGELGGLPFGFIPQMLSSQGVIPDLNTPYVNPATGAVMPDYIPKNAKAMLATALQDLIGSVFTYPGATVGLPSKGSVVRKVVDTPLGVSSKDYNVVSQTDKLTPGHAHESQVIQGLPQNQPQESPLGAPAQDSSIYRTPTLGTSPTIQSVVPRGNKLPVLSKSQIAALKGSGSKRGKKTAQPIPAR